MIRVDARGKVSEGVTCVDCGSVMQSSLEEIWYAFGGHSDVVLYNVEYRRCKCGEGEVVLPRVEHLEARIRSAKRMDAIFKRWHGLLARLAR